MRTIFFVVLFLPLLICAEIHASEYPADTPATTNQTEQRISQLQNSIVELRESFSVMGLRWIGVLLSFLSILVTVALGFVIRFFISYKREIKSYAREAEESAKEAKQSADKAEERGKKAIEDFFQGIMEDA